MKIFDLNSEINASCNFMEGSVILIDKPLEWTSFDVVNKIRHKLKRFHNVKKIKVGHNGTLDPLASGLLMIFTGKYTKLIPHEENHDKVYEAVVKFGATTESLDRETEEIDIKPTSHLNLDLIKDTASGFLGKQIQEVPIYSAAKQDGVALYKLAREGKSVRIKTKEVEFLEMNVLSFDQSLAKIVIKCSKGTYIRAFAKDLGERLNTSAYLYALRRMEIGDFHVKDALSIDGFCDQITDLEYTA